MNWSTESLDIGYIGCDCINLNPHIPVLEDLVDLVDLGKSGNPTLSLSCSVGYEVL